MIAVAKAPTARHLNQVARAARQRADELEGKLAASLALTLRTVGRTAARNFEARTTDYLRASATQPPGWSAPAPDELLDIEALVAALKAKVEPTRNALIKNLVTTALDGVGLSFDARNPFALRVLASAGAHIAGIAQTTQLDIMKAIKASHDNGLSVPDTAKVIRAAMRDSALERATTIARSELNAAVNGGALAATQIVASSTGVTYVKQWLATEDSRTRDDHADADGQVVGLADYFTVGGAAMMHPGDPDGPPEETVSCRCSVVFTDEAPTP